MRTFDSEDKSFTSNQEVTASGKIVGIARANDALVVASESGVVQVSNFYEPVIFLSMTINFFMQMII